MKVSSSFHTGILSCVESYSKLMLQYASHGGHNRIAKENRRFLVSNNNAR